MPTTNEPVDDLCSQERAGLERTLQRFEDDWQRRPRPDLCDYLPKAPGQRLAALIELAHIDLEYRLKAGEPARAENYFQRFPELTGDRRQVLALIVREFELRSGRESTLATGEYEQRFPHLRQELLPLLRLAPPVNAPPALPAATIDSVGTLIDALNGPQLLERRQREELTALSGRFTQPRDLARELVKRGWLTPFQINQLFQGRGADLVLGPYLLLERLGEGGMGTVYKARHRLMGRLAAVKVIRPEHLRQPDAVRRFQREIRAAAQLHHPNIVLAHDAAQVGGTLLLVMEYVEGTDLARLIAAQGALPIGQACDYVRQAALGLQHAHEQGMVHRDIKPSNLLLQKPKPGQTALGTSVKILDLGLARLHSVNDEQTAGELTREGAVMGTPDYIAPEQAQESHTVDIRADIYSLGCTLYQLLTGRVPFPGGTLGQKLVRHMMNEPAPIESLRSALPPGLPELVRRMMAKKPEQRPATPAAVAEALLPYCGQAAPVAVLVTAALPGSAPAAVPVANLPTAALPAPLAVLASPADAPTIAAAAVPLSGSETIPPEAAIAAETVAVLPSPALPRRRRRWLLAGVGVLLLASVIVLSVRPGRKPGVPTEPATSTVALEPLDRLDLQQVPAEDRIALPAEAPPLVAVLGQHRPYSSGGWSTLAVSPEGRFGAVASGPTVFLFDPETLRVRHRWNHVQGDHIVGNLTFSRDGTLLAHATEGGTIPIYNTATGAELRRCGNAPSAITAVALSPDGNRLLAGHYDGILILWDTGTAKEAKRFEQQKGATKSIVFSPDGKHAFTSAGDDLKDPKNTHVRVWELASGKGVRKLDQEGLPIANLLLTQDERRLFCWSGDTLRSWDLNNPQKDATVICRDHPNVAPTQMALSPDGRFILGASRHTPYGASLLEVASGRNVRAFVGHGAGAFLPDGRRVVCLSGDTVTHLDVKTGENLKPVVGHTGPVYGLAFSGNGRFLLSGGANGMALWDLARREPHWVPSVPTSLSQVALSPDGRWALSSHPGGHPDVGPTIFWEVESGREVRRIEPSHGLGGFSPDSRYFLYIGKNRVLSLWDLEKGAELSSFKRAVPEGTSLSFLPHGNRVYSLEGGPLRIWDPLTGKELQTVATAGVTKVQFSADGNRLFTGHGDASVKRWDLTAKEPKPQTFDRWNTGVVHCLALSPDGKRLVSGDPDRRIVLWDPESGKKVREWFQPAHFNQLLFAPDSRHLAIANGDGTIYILRLAPPPKAGR